MKNRSIPELDKLFTEVGTYKKSNEFKELLEFIKEFPHIAPYNAMKSRVVNTLPLHQSGQEVSIVQLIPVHDLW